MKRTDKNRYTRTIVIALIAALLPFARVTATVERRDVCGLYSLSYFVLCLLYAGLVAVITLACLGDSEKIRRRLGRLGLLGVSAALCLIIFEAFLHANPRLIPPRVKASLAANGAFLDSRLQEGASTHPLIRYPFQPESHQWLSRCEGNMCKSIKPISSEKGSSNAFLYSTDYQGFFNLSANITDVDIVFIGDSFTAASSEPYGERWTTLLAGDLGMSHRNLGMGGISPPEAVAILNSFGRPHNPGVVVFSIYEGNDPWDADTWLRWQASGLAYNRFLVLSESLLNRCIVFKWFESAVSTFREEPRHAGESLSGIDGEITFLGDFVDRRTATQGQISGMPGWYATVKAVTDARDWCDNQGAVPYVVFWPSKDHIFALYYAERGMTNQIMGMLGGSTSATDIEDRAALLRDNCNSVESLLQQACSSNGVPYVSLTTALLDAVRTGRMPYYFDDIHANVIGHRVAAEHLAAHFESSRLMPQPK